MRCVRCSSPRMVRFIDGFGQRRVFCRKCWGSFPELEFIKLNQQKNLHDFNIDTYYKSIFNR